MFVVRLVSGRNSAYIYGQESIDAVHIDVGETPPPGRKEPATVITNNSPVAAVTGRQK